MTNALETLTAFLDERGVRYELVSHEPTFTASDDAAAAGIEPAAMIKTVALCDRESYLLAAIPASRTLDLERARAALRATSHLRLASEDEIAAQFPQFEVGAIPPVGSPVPEAVDVRLLYRDRVGCPAGDHEHTILLDPRDIVRLAEPRVADICARTESGSRFHDTPHL